MSANTLTFTCIGPDVPALTALHQQLEAAIGVEAEQWPQPLQGCFEDWEKPYVMSASLRGQTLRFVIDGSAHDEFEKPNIQALHAAGAEHIRVRIWYGQVGETQTQHLHGGKRVPAKSFPAPTLSEGERLYELVLESKDAALAKEIRAGASPDAVVDGKPLFVHVAKARMEKSMGALFDAKVGLGQCLPWAQEIAGAMKDHGGNKSEAMLRALISAPGAQAAALWRAGEVLRPLSKFPEQLAWLMAQDGVDVNAMLHSDEAPPQDMGSLLFNSVEFFEDDPAVLAALAARGARSIAPAGMSAQRRIDRMYWGYRDAETVAQLAAAGVDLNTPTWGEHPLLRSLLRSPCVGQRPLTLATELLRAGASADFWMDPVAFQREVLTTAFNAHDRVLLRDCMADGDLPFDMARDGALIVELMRGLLAQGLDANMEVSLSMMALGRRGQDIRHPRLNYRGSLLGAVACVLCGRGSDMRPICLPLVKLLLAHGASPDAGAARVSGPSTQTLWDIYIHGDWPLNTGGFADTGSVLERLRQRQAQAPDEIDAAVLAALEAAP